jgi:hypothetical protein
MIQFFSDCCEKHNRLFIPDLIRQESVANSLVTHYDAEILKGAIESYVKTNNGALTIFDFAIASKTYASKVEYEINSVNNFRSIVEETKKRIEG